jgi:hypothetical protein
MARISASEREANKRTYDELIFDIFTNEGWDSITYDRLSKDLSVRKSTLQGYYPSRAHFGTALQGKVLPQLLESLDLSSRESFIDSWDKALLQPQFSMVIRLFLENSLTPDTNSSARNGSNNLVRLLQGSMNREEAENLVQMVYGRSIFFFMNE